MPTECTWKCALTYAQRKYKQLRDEPEFYRVHPSFIAEKAIEQADLHLNLGGCGVEGFPGLTYLNMGDTYDTTILFIERTERFRIGSWGDWVERHPNVE